LPDALAPEAPGSLVKLRYASFVNYALNVAGAVFTLFFLTYLARRLVVEDYANWVLIQRYLSYIIIPGVIFSYWLPRNISRGINDSKTGLGASLIMGIIFMPVYVVLMILFSANLEQPLVPLLISTSIVFFDYLGSSLNATSFGHAPQITGYSSFALKAVQAVSGFLLVGFAALGLTGAVIAALGGRIAANLVLLFMNRKIIRLSQFKTATLRCWLRSSWLPLFGNVTSMIYAFDVLVVRISYGSEVPVAYYGISLSLLAAVLFANVVNYSLYPKILSKKNLDDLGEAIWLSLLLSIPVASLMILYAQPLLAIFGLQYIPAAVAFQMLVAYSVVQIFSNLSNTAYVGLEGVDVSGFASSKSLLKSALFKSNIIALVMNGSYLLALSIISTLSLDNTTITTMWGASLLVCSIASLLGYSALLKKDFSVTFPFKKIARNMIPFLVSILPAVVPMLLLPVELAEGFYEMLSNLALPAILSALLYFGTLYALDKKFRKTLREVLVKVRSFR
jgi:hypothetical protein